MEPNDSRPSAAAESEWRSRERFWRRKLGRIRLGVEPVEEQLAKYRRVTWMLTAVSFGLAVMFVSLFAAFRRPDIGMIVAAVLFLPVVAIAWLDFALLRSRVVRYTSEWRDYQGRAVRTSARANDGNEPVAEP